MNRSLLDKDAWDFDCIQERTKELVEEVVRKFSLSGECAQAVLDARALYPDCSLADLYDPLTMPTELRKAHRELDADVKRVWQAVRE